MDIAITGVPVRHWATLRKPIQKSIAGFLDGVGLPYGGEVRINFFGSYGKGHRLIIAFDRKLKHREEVAHLIGGICQGHAEMNDKWYEGFELSPA